MVAAVPRAGGAADGSARSFPSFIGAYRGIRAGEEPANSYIRGWERFGVELAAEFVDDDHDMKILVGIDSGDDACFVVCDR